MAMTGNGHSRHRSCFGGACTSPFPVRKSKSLHINPGSPDTASQPLPQLLGPVSCRRLWGHDLNGRPWWPRAPSASSQWKGEGVAVLAPCPETALGQSAGTQSQADTHTDTSTYTAARTPRLRSATRSAPRPGGKVKELPRPQQRKCLGAALSEARNPKLGVSGT